VRSSWWPLISLRWLKKSSGCPSRPQGPRQPERFF